MNSQLNKYRNKKIIVEIISYLYLILFLYAAVSKLLSYERSELQLAKSPIISDFAFILVWIIPVVEIIIAFLLIVRGTQLLALYSALGLMSIFTAYIVAILNFSDSIPCSCGGVLEKLGWMEHLIFNLVFIILVIIAIVYRTKYR